MLAIENYKDVFRSAVRLENGEIKKNFGDVLLGVVINTKTAEDYEYVGA